ncbi:MAG: hypothetical protein WBB86_07735 [Candidatus Omnitrophota bacterium]
MKLKYLFLVTVIIAILGAGIFYSFNMLQNNKEGNKMDYLKVEFYKILDEVEHTRELDRLLANPPEKFDRKKDMKTEKYVGYAEYKNGKVTIDVTDPDLEKYLKSPVFAMRGRTEGGAVIDEYVKIEPGSKEHLYAAIDELQGYTVIKYTSEEESTD